MILVILQSSTSDARLVTLVQDYDKFYSQVEQTENTQMFSLVDKMVNLPYKTSKMILPY